MASDQTSELTSTVREALRALRASATSRQAVIDRIISDLEALTFHLTDHRGPMLVAVIGGTGTGKSTLINRLASRGGVALTAASFRRTFTSGAVAIARSNEALPEGWLGFPARVVAPSQLPAKGEDASLTIVEHPIELTERISLIDTPDIDGDQPAHHAVADRVFRWCEAIIALLSPEKYQMTELRPYLKLARRYALPLVVVMNKLDDRAVADDARKLLSDEIESSFASKLFTIARDDSTVSIDPSESI
ncbi:MAG TPA: GTP-binding protein, partial [Tepidisphaeraceae bacterium]|nr:GTP-binding protein [Tepidisphaeraceae bacterium]